MPVLFKEIMGSPGGGFGLLFLILGIALFAGVGSLTASCKQQHSASTRSRMLTRGTGRCAWAFSRDGAIPFSNIWSRVNHRYDVPVMALLLATVVDCLLGLIYLGSSAGMLDVWVDYVPPLTNIPS